MNNAILTLLTLSALQVWLVSSLQLSFVQLHPNSLTRIKIDDNLFLLANAANVNFKCTIPDYITEKATFTLRRENLVDGTFETICSTDDKGKVCDIDDHFLMYKVPPFNGDQLYRYECGVITGRVEPVESIFLNVYKSAKDIQMSIPQDQPDVLNKSSLPSEFYIKAEITSPNAGLDKVVKSEWFRNGVPIKASDGKYSIKNQFDSGSSTLTFNNRMTMKDAAVYMVRLTGPKNKFLNGIQFVYGEAYLAPGMSESKNKQEGDAVEIKCPSYGLPPSDSVQWTIDGVAVQLMTNSSLVLSTSEHGIRNDTLRIQSLSYDDKGDYTCTVMNEHGMANHTTTVRVKDKLAALWPFIGICIEVVVLVTIILLYERRRKTREAAEDEVDETNEQTVPLQTTLEEADLRQRNV